MSEPTSREPGDSHVTAILTAMPEEAAAVRAALRDVHRVRGAANQWRGRFGDHEVVLAISGDGERNARRAATQLCAARRAAGLDRARWDRLLILGVAGGLSPQLRTGDLVASAEVCAESGGGRLFGDRALLDVAVRHARAIPSVVVSSTNIADTCADKQRLLARHTAVTGEPTAVVDLESFSYAAEAVKTAVPWLILRVVSDAADEALPSLLNRCRDAGGAVQRSRVLRVLLTDPRPLPNLLRLRRRVASASVRLAEAVTAVLAHPPLESRAESAVLSS
jgi:nucleoside phosphorylase